MLIVEVYRFNFTYVLFNCKITFNDQSVYSFINQMQ